MPIGRSRSGRTVVAALLLGALNPPLDFADGVHVIGHGVRSPGPSVLEQTPQLVVHRVQNARCSRAPAQAAAADVPPSPNSRSNTTRGLFSVGFGVVGELHESVFM